MLDIDNKPNPGLTAGCLCRRYRCLDVNSLVCVRGFGAALNSIVAGSDGISYHLPIRVKWPSPRSYSLQPASEIGSGKICGIGRDSLTAGPALRRFFGPEIPFVKTVRHLTKAVAPAQKHAASPAGWSDLMLLFLVPEGEWWQISFHKQGVQKPCRQQKS